MPPVLALSIHIQTTHVSAGRSVAQYTPLSLSQQGQHDFAEINNKLKIFSKHFYTTFLIDQQLKEIGNLN
jgi:hypothetical protein